ncbi:MAG: ATP-binding protein [Sphingomonas sp.]
MAAPLVRSNRSAPRWMRRFALIRQRRLVALAEIATLFVAIAVGFLTYKVVSAGDSTRLLSPPVVALLLVANLVPAMALMVLLARRIAKGRAARSAIGGGGRLHVRLVALFSAVAAIPTLLVVIFASLLFQYGQEFWFGDKTRLVLVNADRVAQAYVAEHKARILSDLKPMRADTVNVLSEIPVDDPRFSEFFARQIAYRTLSEAAIVGVNKDGSLRLIAGAFLDARALEKRLPRAALPLLRRGGERVTTEAGDRIEATVALDPAASVTLYIARVADPLVLRQAALSNSALSAYNTLRDRSRVIQLRFNLALFVVSLLIVAAAIWFALSMADRLVRPLSELAGAARRVASGDLTVRVSARTPDEVGTLGAAFNRMTRRLEEQTGALVAANELNSSRRSLIEAVLSGVSAGIVSVDGERRVQILNASAETLLGTDAPYGRPLAAFAPELDRLIDGKVREAIVEMMAGSEPRTLAVKVARAEDGHVLTFDDITQQLHDQRRAAWADVARRIAHEIKNPLTPIQLAAERLQRRYGKEIASDPETFARLTQTIVRQVGDLRRMVDEFSSFARMPKPVFREEAIADIVGQAVFLHEVAHPAIRFTLDAPEPAPTMVCDRRQIGQALTNIVKNAVEAVEARDAPDGAIHVTVREEGDRLPIDCADTGIGLPAERERLTEPYMTTRARGTGLGLAIVKTIVENHLGTIAFADRAGGGTLVRLSFDTAMLARIDPGEQPADDTSVPAGMRMRNG